MTKTIVQFAYKYVSPESMNWGPVIDCRTMPNPYKKGFTDEYLKGEVRKTANFALIVKKALDALAEHDTIYIGCAFGKHRSGAVADEVANLTGAKIKKYPTAGRVE